MFCDFYAFVLQTICVLRPRHEAITSDSTLTTQQPSHATYGIAEV